MTGAGAAGASSSPATLRARVDAIGSQYFAAQARSRELDAELATLDRSLALAGRQAEALHAVAVQRAVQLYEGSTQGFVALFDVHDAMESARRAVLLARATDHTDALVNQYVTAAASMREQRKEVLRARAAQQRVVADLAQQQTALEHALAQAQAAYQAHLLAAAQAKAKADAQARAKQASSSHSVPVNDPPAVTHPPSKPVQVPPPPPTHPGVNPHHDDPFLVCTRSRESHGFYGAVNPAGYYGAYQFSQPTWDVTANHAGEPQLIGVRPSQASEYDQDQLAWVLYQWQGSAPWGGLC